MAGTSPDRAKKELDEIVKQKIEALRPKLLDLSRRNPLISVKLSPRSNSHLRVVDELPDVLFFRLSNNQKMRIIPLPPLEEDPKDEQTESFLAALANARLTDNEYIPALDAIPPDSEDSLDRTRELERALRDRVRQELGMPSRVKGGEVNLVQHARNNGISSTYELPKPDEEHPDGRHTDQNIQTLLLPKDLERKLNSLHAKCKTWMQESGLNVLHVAFGLLEWQELGSSETAFAPIVLFAAQLEKRRTRTGVEFWICGTGEEPELNPVMAEKLRAEFGIELPQFQGDSVEEYLRSLSLNRPESFTWKVRRQVVVGVFPSARMAMYHDLDTKSEDFNHTPIVVSLLGGSGDEGAAPFADEYDVDHPAVECKVPLLVRDADSSQFSVLVDLADGKNVAVEGPPGTGKSQTIVNAIAAALADGKKVLFVAEKQAALNVVRSRLEAVGLGAFLLSLQAERSSREQVIASIRERLELREIERDRSYDSKLAAFKQIRGQLAYYIAVLKQPFNQTGLTVREVLGKSLHFNARLAHLPLPVIDEVRLPANNIFGTGLSELRQLADTLAAAHSDAAQTGDAWKGTQLKNFDRFTLEEACDWASRAAKAFRALSACRSELADVGIPSDVRFEEIAELAQCLADFAKCADLLPPNSVVELLRGETANRLLEFFEKCADCQDSVSSLAKRLTGRLSPETLLRLHSIDVACKDFNVDTIDIQALEDKLAKKRAQLENMKDVAARLTPFVQAHPKSAKWRIGDFCKAYELIRQTSRRALLYRDPAAHDGDAPRRLRRLSEEGRALQQQREKLREYLTFSPDIKKEDLAESLSILRKSGALGIFSNSYRRAKRYYTSISLSTGFCKREAIAHLEALLAWMFRENRLVCNPQTVFLFGLHFEGIDTDFETFIELADFYEKLNTLFGIAESRSIKSFLREENIENLQDFPFLPSIDRDVSYEKISGIIEDTESEISELVKAIEVLRPLVTIFRDPASIHPGELKALAAKVQATIQAQNELQDDEVAKRILTAAFDGWRTDTSKVCSIVEWALKSKKKAGTLANIIAADEVDKGRDLLNSIQKIKNEADSALSQVAAKAQIAANNFVRNTEAETAEALEQASLRPESLEAHARFGKMLQEIRRYGIGRLAEEHLHASGSLSALSDVIEAIASRSLAKAVFAKHGEELAKFGGQRLNKLRSNLAYYDKEIIKLSRKQLAAKLLNAARPPGGNGVGRKSSWTQMCLIKNEIEKKQRFISVRDLTERAGQALLELKPCWMMSPLAVAQYVKKTALTFDLCIIDEASQMPPESAIGALLRSKQTMIVGDTNQLPPMNFFKKIVDDDDANEDETVPNESILEIANATFRPARRLRWHYRSRHSGLIKFSNRMVYNDSLIVFPSATESSSRMGIEYRRVAGLYKSGTNPIEAKAVVAAALDFMRNDPRRSLGIVTLNQKQRDLIKEEFEYAASRDDEVQKYLDYWRQHNDGLEEFFIKNLENVQGDERDVIFIGTVYGRESADTPVMQRFGPINGSAGRRRLNVLFSRAREKIVTFSSMSESDILADGTRNDGVYMLKRWLEYSATGRLDGGAVTPDSEPDSEFEQFVIDQVRSMGCEAVPQVGVSGYFIDIGVKHPEWPHGFLLGIECDGATYHSAKSARDRDRLRQEVLENLGWYLHRIWSTDWFNNPRRQAEVLRDVIRRRLVELKEKEADFIQRSSANSFTNAEKPDHQEDTYKRSTLQCIISDDQNRPLVEGGRGSSAAAKVVEIGDTVRIRFLSDADKVLQIIISQSESDPSRGIIHYKAPLAKALLGCEEDEEVEIPVGSYIKRAVIEKIIGDNGADRLH